MLVSQSSDGEALEQSSGQHSPPESSRQPTQQSEAGTVLHRLHFHPPEPTMWRREIMCVYGVCFYVSASQLRSLLQRHPKDVGCPSPSKRKPDLMVRCMTGRFAYKTRDRIETGIRFKARVGRESPSGFKVVPY